MKKLSTLVFLLILLFFPSEYIVAQQVTFGTVTDIHFAEIPRSGKRNYSQSLDKLQECIDTMNKHKISFLVELGDFIDKSQPPDE